MHTTAASAPPPTRRIIITNDSTTTSTMSDPLQRTASPSVHPRARRSPRKIPAVNRVIHGLWGCGGAQKFGVARRCHHRVLVHAAITNAKRRRVGIKNPPPPSPTPIFRRKSDARPHSLHSQPSLTLNFSLASQLSSTSLYPAGKPLPSKPQYIFLYHLWKNPLVLPLELIPAQTPFSPTLAHRA